MNSISWQEAHQIYEDNPTTFKRQEARVGNLNLVLFDYWYANWQVFRDYPKSRNLRGVIFDADTKEVVSLPFHKFFNVNENEETKEERLIFSGLLFDKQDGSMVQATLYNGQLVVASRSSLTGYVHTDAGAFIEKDVELTKYISQFPHHTFLFEFLDPKNRIVLAHNTPELVFLNARDKYTGAYVGHYHRGVIPTRQTPVQELGKNMWNGIKEGLEKSENFEGYVMWLAEHGDFYKAKTSWYVASHKLVTEQSPRGYLEAWASDTLDDLAASLSALGHGEVLKEISRYIKNTEKMLTEKINNLLAVAKGGNSPKEVAVAMNSGHVQDDVDRMIFGAIMTAYREGDLSFGNVFNTLRESLAGQSNRLKTIVEAVDK